MMQDEKVVIIIPTYNEALVISDTIHQVFATTAAIPDKKISVLIFDSNSTDNTAVIVQSLQAQYETLHLLSEQQKSGLGSAYWQAMHHAMHDLHADIVVEFDADLSHQPKYLIPMLAAMDQQDVVVGSRYVSGGSIPASWPLHRKFLSIFGNLTARSLLSPKYRDLTSGFRATRCSVLKKLMPQQFLSNQYAYKLHLMWLLHQHKVRVLEIPIEFVDREKGVSKLPKHSIVDSLRVLLMLRLSTLKRYLSMCLVGLLGMVVQLVTYNLLRFNLPPLKAAQIAVLVAIIHNYLLNNRYTFKRKSPLRSMQKMKSLTLFSAYSLMMINMQSYLLNWAILRFGRGYIVENSLFFSVIVIGSVINYFFYSKLVWRFNEPAYSIPAI